MRNPNVAQVWRGELVAALKEVGLTGPKQQRYEADDSLYYRSSARCGGLELTVQRVAKSREGAEHVLRDTIAALKDAVSRRAPLVTALESGLIEMIFDEEVRVRKVKKVYVATMRFGYRPAAPRTMEPVRREPVMPPPPRPVRPESVKSVRPEAQPISVAEFDKLVLEQLQLVLTESEIPRRSSTQSKSTSGYWLGESAGCHTISLQAVGADHTEAGQRVWKMLDTLDVAIQDSSALAGMVMRQELVITLPPAEFVLGRKSTIIDGAPHFRPRLAVEFRISD